MNSHSLAYPKTTIFLLLAAVVALILGASALAPSFASAAGGGVSLTEEGEKADTDSGSDKGAKKVNKRKYRRLWNKASNRDKRWARRTSDCESGGDPDAIGGGGRYRGAFQFMRATWRSAPKSPGGDPIAYNYKTQAVVAIALKRSDGRGHWPTCG